MSLLDALRLAVFLVASPSLSAGQEPQPRLSGPEAGTALTTVGVYAPTGPRAGTTYDAAAALARGPSALLFVAELTRNVAPMIRAFDRLATEHGLLGLHTCTVLLASDRTAAEKHLERASAALSLTYPMVVSVDGSDGPGSYGLDRKCTLTLVLAEDGKVVRSVGYTDTGAQDVPQLERWIVELTGPVPRDLAGLRAILERRYPDASPELLDLTASLLVQARQQQPRTDARMAANPERGARARPQPDAADAEAKQPREGKAPDDPELRELLRAVIQKTATAADLDAAFRDVDARVGEDAALEQQAVEMFKRVLGLGYGTEAAKERCRAYVAAHDRGASGGK